MRTLLLSMAIAAAPLGNLSAQEDPAVIRGRHIARIWCASCHAVEKIGESPLPIAPPFRKLGSRYPIETLEEPLAEGIVTGHPTMPQFKLEPNQIQDFIAYLKSIQD